MFIALLSNSLISTCCCIVILLVVLFSCVLLTYHHIQYSNTLLLGICYGRLGSRFRLFGACTSEPIKTGWMGRNERKFPIVCVCATAAASDWCISVRCCLFACLFVLCSFVCVLFGWLFVCLIICLYRGELFSLRHSYLPFSLFFLCRCLILSYTNCDTHTYAHAHSEIECSRPSQQIFDRNFPICFQTNGTPSQRRCSRCCMRL